ncbi:sce7726 family protein [Photobacterium kasasachensis]|uniref:sce7726 family protein n=1 Tax=Photobacterium kasasachensis TaxID=2910240 RepID=UPI003D0A49C4
MNISERILVSRLFSRKSMLMLAQEDGHKKIRDEILAPLGEEVETLRNAFDSIYSNLLSEYRNEYVYKNAIAEKIVKGRHRLANVSYFTEFRVRKVIADCVVVNGSSTAYEIKTEYDSFSRLINQINTYKQVFEVVNVVIPESKLDKLLPILPNDIGIVILTERYTFSDVQNSAIHTNSLDHDLVFDCLNKSEVFDIILRNFEELPDAKPAFVREACKEMFSYLSKDQACREFKLALKQRAAIEKNKKTLVGFPNSLLSLLCVSNFSDKSYGIMLHNLDQKLT